MKRKSDRQRPAALAALAMLLSAEARVRAVPDPEDHLAPGGPPSESLLESVVWEALFRKLGTPSLGMVTRETAVALIENGDQLYVGASRTMTSINGQFGRQGAEKSSDAIGE